MNDVAKVIPLCDRDFPVRQRSAPRHWPSQPGLRPVTSLTERLAQVPPRQQRGLGDLVRDRIADGVRGTLDFAFRCLGGV